MSKFFAHVFKSALVVCYLTLGQNCYLHATFTTSKNSQNQLKSACCQKSNTSTSASCCCCSTKQSDKNSESKKPECEIKDFVSLDAKIYTSNFTHKFKILKSHMGANKPFVSSPVMTGEGITLSWAHPNFPHLLSAVSSRSPPELA